MKILKIIGSCLAAILILGAGLFVGLWVYTKADRTVPATVVDDGNLPSIIVHDVKLHAQIYGAENEKTVLVLHGGPGGDFRSLLALKELADAYRVIFYDQRGAGLSQRVSEAELSIDDHVRELDGVLELFDRGQETYLIGHSWGGILGAAFLGQNSAQIEGAILMEPGYLNAEERANWVAQSEEYMSDVDFFRAAMLAGFEAQHVQGVGEDAIDDYLIGKMAHFFADANGNPYHCAGESYDAPYWRYGAMANNAAGQFSAAQLNQIEADLANVTTPILLMAGACNDWIGAPLQERHLAMFGNAELAIVPDAGHDMVWDNPEVTLKIVRNYLDRLGS